jgi:hypothetical protein
VSSKRQTVLPGWGRFAGAGCKLHASSSIAGRFTRLFSLVSGKILRTLEWWHQDETAKEASNVCPEGHAAGRAAEGRQSGKELDQESVAGHTGGRYGDCRDEESEKEQGMHMRPRIEPGISFHQSADGPGGTIHGNDTRRVDRRLYNRGRREFPERIGIRVPDGTRIADWP